jgi:preprotein translocase subunit SecD
LPLYKAVKLAAKQPPYISNTNSRSGAEYFLFGKPGSAACAAAARGVHSTPLVGAPCYLAGPTVTASALTSQLTKGVSAGAATEASPQTIKVNQGWVVMDAAPERYGESLPLANPTAQFYVLRDNAALFGNEITHPKQSTDQTGSPDVKFGFTSKGANQFQRVTAEIARRGELVSGLGRKLFQHFAVALDTQLVTVPYIDYMQNPFGIPGNEGADIQGAFTIHSAGVLARQLGLAPLPVKLKLISRRT